MVDATAERLAGQGDTHVIRLSYQQAPHSDTGPDVLIDDESIGGD